jgi:hypothetical protein
VAQRLDIAYRVIEGVNDTVIVNYNSLGAKTCTIAPSLYMSSRALAAALQTAIDDQWSASTSFEVSANADGTISIDSTGANFTLAWDSLSLMDWLGFDGALAGGYSSFTGELQPGVLLESMPWVEDTHGWIWSMRGVSHKHQSQAAKVSRRDLWSVRVFEKRDNLSQLRSVLGHWLRGTPATWYRSATVSAWSYTNWHGALEVCADPRRLSYDEAYENPGNLQDVLSVELRMVAI